MAQLIKITVRGQKEKDFDEWLFLSIHQGQNVDLERPLPPDFARAVASVRGSETVHMFYFHRNKLFVTEINTHLAHRLSCTEEQMLDALTAFA